MLKFIAQNFLYDHDEMSVLQLKGIRVKYQEHIRICKHTSYIYITQYIGWFFKNVEYNKNGSRLSSLEP